MDAATLGRQRGRQGRAARPGAGRPPAPPAGRRGRLRGVRRRASPWPGRRCVDAATVAAYVSVGSEPGTGLLLDALVAAGKRVLVPVVLPDLDLDWALVRRARRPRPRRARAARADRTAARRRRRRAAPTWCSCPGLAVSPAGDAARARAAAATTARWPGCRPGPRSRSCCTTTRSASPCRRAPRPAGRDAGGPRPGPGIRAVALTGGLGGPVTGLPSSRRQSAPAGRRPPPRRRRGCTPRAGSRPRRRARSGRSSATTRGWPETPVRLIQRESSKSASETTIRIDGAAVTS